MIKQLLRSIFFAAFACAFINVDAQDIHFSQYNASPLLLNPALAGMNACDYRVYANFRTQWLTVSEGNTYRTFAAGADMSVGKVTKVNSYAGLGLSFFADQAGDISFNSNRVDLTFAYHLMLNRKGTQQISAGIQAAFNHRGINPSKATYDEQYDPRTGGINPVIPGENYGRTKIFYGDAGLGLLYSGLLRNQTNLHFGFALNHINQPKISFYPTPQNGNATASERLYMKITLHGGASVPISTRLSVLPNFMVLVQGSSYEFNVGMGFKSIVGNVVTSKTAFYAGIQYRGLLDAVIATARVDYKGFSCGLSYDINISKLMPATNTIGAPEISVIYTGCYRKKPKPGFCPVML